MTRRTSLRQWLQRLIRRHLWGVDVHASSWIAETALIDRTWPRGVHIGRNVVIGEEAVVLTHDMTRGLYLDTRIGDGVVIGPRAIILPGISVGEGAVIAPGAVVNRDVPPHHHAIGSPAVAEPLGD